MTQQALLLDQTNERSCASATSCCVSGHADEEAFLTTCATCMMNYHKECVEAFVQNVVGAGQGIKHTLPMFSSVVSYFQRRACVWQRTCSTLLARDRCRPCPPRMQFRVSVGEMPHEKE